MANHMGPGPYYVPTLRIHADLHLMHGPVPMESPWQIYRRDTKKYQQPPLDTILAKESCCLLDKNKKLRDTD